ncbi:hypothetical protein [Xanthomonas prunicola]|uniref:Transmembrane protein n=1 Tax=Xanthomonas prunicola TaxID=2053930 RepID=A0A2N3RDT8_9XANT|nr:hypothetical protein [Xanthomonas prunicola]PKV10653.1 hypothetical protein XpruCFBP8353_22295 [Xanthomonas prunicola]PKV14901.1 hypothetical protein XpruCFBP8354_22475 [Xanthomonas prunicola]PKV19874.1 hypothetical protein CVO74_17235 [Xanthomonas prunicola]UXA47088.1 hypothetical protein M0D44_11780 [Xanthomonas prunicola]UXA55558.1 hypothetical protein M0D47_11815 [Xanthomonas prunicola]
MKVFLLVVSALLYIAALCLPALQGGAEQVSGVVLLMFGWIQVFDGQCFAWLSNLLFFGAWLCYFFKSYRTTLGLLLSACLIGMDTFRATRYLKNEAGHEVIIDRVGAAFYVWELSFLALLIVVLMRMAKNRDVHQKAIR